MSWHDWAQCRHIFAQRCICASLSNCSQLAAHAAHASAHTRHVLGCSGDIRIIKSARWWRRFARSRPASECGWLPHAVPPSVSNTSPSQRTPGDNLGIPEYTPLHLRAHVSHIVMHLHLPFLSPLHIIQNGVSFAAGSINTSAVSPLLCACWNAQDSVLLLGAATALELRQPVARTLARTCNEKVKSM